MQGHKAGLEGVQTALGDPSSIREGFTAAGSQQLFIMCQILQNQSVILRRDAMEIRAKAYEIRSRARTLRR